MTGAEFLTVAADGLSWVLIVTGSIFALISGVGMLRMPDFYSRMHAAGIADTAGAGFLIPGLMIQAGLSLVTVKLLLILVFMFFTSPTATHAVAKAAIGAGIAPWTRPEDRR